MYDVATDAGDFVVRVLVEASHEQWRRQIALLRVVADAGIAPPLAWVDEGERATVSPKIAGQLSSALCDPATRPRAIASVVDALARLHRLRTDPFAPADPVAMARALWQEQSAKPGFPAWALPAAHTDRPRRGVARGGSASRAEPQRHEPDERAVGRHARLARGLGRVGAESPVLRSRRPLDVPPPRRPRGARSPRAAGGATITREQAETFRALRRLGAILCGTMFFRLAGDLASAVPQRAGRDADPPAVLRPASTGELALRSPVGQATFGAAMLKEAITA